MNKKMISLVVVLMMILSSIVSFAENEYRTDYVDVSLYENNMYGSFNTNIPIKVWYQGQYIFGDSNAVIKNDRTQVPVRFVSLALGYQVDWDGETRMITLSDNQLNKLELQLDSSIAKVNGIEKELDNAVFADEKGRSYVPLRFVSEAFGEKVYFDANAKVAVIGNDYQNNEYYPVRFFYGTWEDELNQGDYLTSEKINFTDLKPSIMWGDMVVKKYDDETSFMTEFFSKNCGYLIPVWCSNFSEEEYIENLSIKLPPMTANEVVFPRTIEVSEQYVKALKKYARKKSTSTTAEQADIADEEYKNNMIIAKVMPGDYVKYEVNHLPEEMRIEFSLLACDLINSVREKFGVPKMIVSQGSLDFADSISKQYVDDDWGWHKMEQVMQDGAEAGHNAKGINKVARKYGLYTTSSKKASLGWQYYENLGIVCSYDSVNSARTKLGLKTDVYFNIVDFLFDRFEWNHAAGTVDLYQPAKEYYAVGYSLITENEADTTVNFHSIAVPDLSHYYRNRSKFDRKAIKPTATFARWRYDEN